MNGNHDLDQALLNQADAYSEAVKAFSERSQDDHLLCGIHYRDLALLLHPSPLPNLPSDPTLIIAEQTTTAGYVTVIDLQKVTLPDRQQSEVSSRRELSTPKDFLDGPQINADRSQLIFLNGYPSREWVMTLGGTFRIDPEFWRRSQSFLHHRKYHDLPPLPSFSQRTFHLQVSTIFNRDVPITRERVDSLRVDGWGEIWSHHVNLERQGAVGESIRRQLHAYSESIYSIEQYISCTLVTKNGGWAVVIWLDIGKSTGDCFPDCCTPIIQPTTNAALHFSSRSVSPGRTSSSALFLDPHHATQSTTQSSRHLSSQYGQSLKVALMRASPLYALGDIFRHSACSSNQMVNMLMGRVEDALRASYLDRHEGLSLKDLRFIKNVLDEHSAYLEEVVWFLQSGLSAWLSPQPTSNFPQHTNQSMNMESSATNNKSGMGNKKLSGAIDATQIELLEDYRCLLRRCQRLAARCKDGTDIIINGAALRESQRGIEQAEEVKLLTKLVFLFAPLSFVTSIFGMNFVDLSVKQGLAALLTVAVFLLIALLVALSKCGRRHLDTLHSIFS
ncbi:hypothetical protein H0G86_002619 [Trichoderma simmonsii]|uniref:Uncharacterized protein n=1 Tax=Trichoderma simmonsii TaxID=1491479 RepID=A0A8G0PBQ5_9HYPO|nr:hypothetical protein H0G86_002619 [Trichoderma simmonsii]